MKAKSKRSTEISKKPDRLVRLRIVCAWPPNAEDYGATFGLQDDSSTKEWVIHAGKKQPNGDVWFECECRTVISVHRTGQVGLVGIAEAVA